MGARIVTERLGTGWWGMNVVVVVVFFCFNGFLAATCMLMNYFAVDSNSVEVRHIIYIYIYYNHDISTMAYLPTRLFRLVCVCVSTCCLDAKLDLRLQ